MSSKKSPPPGRDSAASHGRGLGTPSGQLDPRYVERRLGKLHVEGLEGLDENVRHREVAEPLFVRRHDEPRRLRRAAARQGLFVRRGVLVPKLSVREVAGRELPLLRGIVQPLLEPAKQ